MSVHSYLHTIFIKPVKKKQPPLRKLCGSLQVLLLVLNGFHWQTCSTQLQFKTCNGVMQHIIGKRITSVSHELYIWPM